MYYCLSFIYFKLASNIIPVGWCVQVGYLIYLLICIEIDLQGKTIDIHLLFHLFSKIHSHYHLWKAFVEINTLHSSRETILDLKILKLPNLRIKFVVIFSNRKLVEFHSIFT